MGNTGNRDLVCYAAKNQNPKALELGLKIEDPWDRAQALASVAFYGAESSFTKVIQYSMKASYCCPNGYQVVGSAAWPIRAMIERNHLDLAKKELPRLINTAQGIDHGVNRIDALFLLLEGIFPAGNPLRRTVFDTLIKACSETNSWKAGLHSREAILMMGAVDWEVARQALDTMPEGKFKKQTLDRFEDDSFPPPRRFFY
jgi:hypothetical protein